MKKDDIFLNDWKRIFFGEAPPEFLLEVFIRTLVIYVVLLFVVRLLGKRMSGQLTLTETAIMITLGAIVSLPMQAPDRGIAQGILVLFLALAFQWGVNIWGYKSSKAEKIIQGNSNVLIKDGVLQLDEMAKVRISRQELFAMLRHNNIYNLGLVERAYLEGCGLLSVFSFKEEKPGLSLMPDKDTLIHDTENKKEDLQACCSCGFIKKRNEPDSSCQVCGKTEWSVAVA